MVSWGVLGAPLYTLAAYKGMGEGPKALRKAKLLSHPGEVVDFGDVKIPKLKADVSDGRTKNLEHFKRATASIRDAAKSVNADRALLLGGECSVTVGSVAGFSEVFEGRPGMLWMDAHGDFNVPETSPSGYIGGMCLAMACGRGPRLTDGAISAGPLIAEERLVHVGARDLDPPEIAAFNSSPAKLFTAQQVRKSGAADVAEEAARHLANRSDWVICHLDVDVVDPSLIPSVNYPTPGGLTLEEAAAIIRALNRTEKLKVFELTSYNAEKDRKRTSAKVIAEQVKLALF